MKVIFARSILNSGITLKNTVAAIGIFDGLHRGHRYLLERMLAQARAFKAKSMAITFFPHPAHVLRPDVKLGYLMSLPHRLKLLEGLGVDICLVIHFDKKIAAIDPESFVRDMLVRRLGVRAIFVGRDFRFGRDRAGDITLLQGLSSVYGYHMRAVPALMQGKEPISSTRLRRLVAAGDLIKTKQLLGRPFSVLGKVVRGRGRGKGLGYPTANVEYGSHIVPPLGVYAVRVFWKNKTLEGVANLGLRPSFKDKDPKIHLETHIFDFKQDLYGQVIEVFFIKKIRDEKKFSSPAELAAQITKDIVKARRYFR